MSLSRYKVTTSALFLCALGVFVYSCLVFYQALTRNFKGFYVFTDKRVIQVLPYSKAARNGLCVGDIVMSIDGHPTSSLVDYLYQSRDLTRGKEVRLIVARNGEQIPITADVTRHPFPVSALVWLIIGMGALAAGFAVYVKHPDTNGAPLFCLISAFTVSAFVGGANWYIIIDNVELLSVFIITGTLLTPMALHFCLVFPARKELTRRHRWLIPALYLPHLGFLGCFEGYNIRAYLKYLDGDSLRHAFQIIYALAGWYFALVGLYLLVGLISIVHSYRARTTSPAGKQLKWIFWAAAAATVPVCLTVYVAVADFPGFAFGGATAWVLMASILMIMGQAFALTKYRLSDVDVVLSRSIGYFLVSGVAVGGYYCLVFLCGFLLTMIAGENSPAATVVSILAIAIIFRPVSELVQKLVDKRFHRDKYRYEQTILEVSTAVISILDMDELLAKIADTVTDKLRVTRVFILLRNDKAGRFDVKVSRGKPPVPHTFNGQALAADLEKNRTALVAPTPFEENLPDSEALAEMASAGAAIALPLFYEDRLIGVFCLGEKISQEIYSTDEVRLLRTLANEAAIAIRNALSYRTIQELNLDLAEKVKRIDQQRVQISSLQKQLVNENKYLREQIRERYNFREIIGSSKAMQDVLQLTAKIARSSSAVLIRGESGTGKELIARAIHFNSDRRNKPFVKVNCAALSEGVLESELFGHERGSFTGAIRQKVGRFELADGGAIFLDEIGDIPLKTQVRLLRVLQEKEFERVGGNETVNVDVRVIASTHRDIEALIQDEHFREDLFYRLNVITVHVPSLRERREDIPEMAIHFLNKFNRELGKNVRNIDSDALQRLMEYEWPGNVRELENMMERAVVLAEGQTITMKDLPIEQGPELGPASVGRAPLPAMLESLERERIQSALDRAGGNKSQAARSLGIKRTTFLSKLRKFNMA
ncbi:MAG: sigma 54-interacting transcriptional regulator [Planctomycetota bacterium]